MNERQIQLIKETLESMQGIPYLYGNNTYIIKSYQVKEELERVYIQANKKHFDRPFDAVMEFLGKWEPVEVNEITKYDEGFNLPKRSIDSSVISALKDELLDNIKKVKENKAYIPQAEAVRSSVDSIITLAKTEIEYMETFIRLNKKV